VPELPYQYVGAPRRFFYLLLRGGVVTLVGLAGSATLRGEGAAVVGVVRDAAGAPVAGASVEPRGKERALPPLVTGGDGSFAFDPLGESGGTLTVRAPGFASASRPWSAADAGGLAIVLDRQGPTEAVTVTASRGEARLGDTAARVTVFDRDALRTTAAPTIDDTLRQVPGFTLFRRSTACP
jgi:hypothetical protein